MAKFSYSFTTFTPTATADAATVLANGTYMNVQGGNATQRLTFLEVYLGGQAGASSPTFMLLSRDSTVGVTMSSTSGAMQAALDGTHSVLSVVPIGYTIAGTNPQRSTTLHLLNLSYNAFGGIVRWVAAPGEEPSTIGNTASLGEVSLSAFTGGTAGLTGAHIVYEAAICKDHATESLSDTPDGHRHHRANRKTTARERLAPYISGAI